MGSPCFHSFPPPIHFQSKQIFEKFQTQSYNLMSHFHPTLSPKGKKIPLLLGWSRKSLQLLKSTQSGLFLCLQCHSGCFLPGLIRSWLLLLLTYTLAFFRSLKGQGTFLSQGLCTAVSSAARHLTNSSSSLRYQHKCLFCRDLFPHPANEVRFFT